MGDPISAIFYHDEQQKLLAEQSKQALIEFRRLGEILTEITQASTFYVAGEYHHDFYKKNPIRYKFYRCSCGRDRRLKELYGESE